MTKTRNWVIRIRHSPSFIFNCFLASFIFSKLTYEEGRHGKREENGPWTPPTTVGTGGNLCQVSSAKPPTRFYSHLNFWGLSWYDLHLMIFLLLLHWSNKWGAFSGLLSDKSCSFYFPVLPWARSRSWGAPWSLWDLCKNTLWGNSDPQKLLSDTYHNKAERRNWRK